MHSTLFRLLCAGGGGAAAVADSSLSSVVFLAGFEGQADGSTTIADESTTANKGNATANGNVQIDTAEKKFGEGSLLFDGTGDYASWADHADWRLSAANSDLFTIEFWVRWNANSISNMRVMGHAGAAGNIGWYINSTTSAGSTATVSFVYSSDGNSGASLTTVTSGTSNLATNTWHHIAVSKNAAGKIRIWRNGTLDASATPADSSFFNSTNAFELGRALASSIFNGALDEVRITKGVCRYDTDDSITVPTAAFPRT